MRAGRSRWNRTPEQAARFRRDCGARRFAYNWAVIQIKEAFRLGEQTGGYDNTVWSAYSLRKRWNQVKDEAAPWWAENSKEAYAGGIAGAVTALKTGTAPEPGNATDRRSSFPA